MISSMQKLFSTKRSPFYLLSIGLGITLIIILIMGWNIYWENLKQKQQLLEQIQQIQRFYQARRDGTLNTVGELSLYYPSSDADYQAAQQKMHERLAFYNLDLHITLFVVLIAIISLILSWFFIFRTLLHWKKQIYSSHEQLDKKVHERTKNLKHANQLLQQEIKENKILSEALQRNQKLQAVGTLAAGIAHDYNNYLATILAHSEFLASKVNTDIEQEAAQGIIDVTQKASHLTQELLTFARRGKHERKQLHLHDVIQQALKILTPNLPKHIALHTQLADELWQVSADSDQIIHVIINLGLNARDAMPSEGHLTIATHNQDFSQSETLPEPELKPQRYVTITVSDTGEGIDKDIQSKIFEPFYTTKDIGKGTGLGLAVAYGIMQQHKGLISVHSEPDQQPGTTFTLYFPA